MDLVGTGRAVVVLDAGHIHSLSLTSFDLQTVAERCALNGSFSKHKPINEVRFLILPIST